MIEVSRNSIIIRNVDFSSESYTKFTKSLSVWNPAQFKYESSVINIVDNDIYVPASIGIKYVAAYFPTKEVIYSNKCAATKPLNFIMRSTPKDDIQREAIKFITKMKNDDKNRSRFLSLKPNSGKTYISIVMISLFKVKAMIIVDKESLAEQWKLRLTQHSTLEESRIKILSGQKQIEDAVANPDNYDVYIAMHATLNNVLKKDKNGLNELNNKLGIGFRIFDEAHLNFKNICAINSLSNVEYTLYLTATPSRSGFRENTLYGKVFHDVPYYNGLLTDPTLKKRYINCILYKFSSQPDEKTKMACKTKQGFSVPLWARYLETEKYDSLFNCIKEIFENFKLKEYNLKIAIVLPTINLINKVKDDLDEYLGESCGVFVGGLSKEEQDAALNSKIFITNPKVFGEGIDVQDLEVLINFVPFTSQGRLEQLIGRIRYGDNKAHVYIDVTDTGFPKCRTQLYTRKKYFQNEAWYIKSIQEK